MEEFLAIGALHHHVDFRIAWPSSFGNFKRANQLRKLMHHYSFYLQVWCIDGKWLNFCSNNDYKFVRLCSGGRHANIANKTGSKYTSACRHFGGIRSEAHTKTNKHCSQTWHKFSEYVPGHVCPMNSLCHLPHNSWPAGRKNLPSLCILSGCVWKLEGQRRVCTCIVENILSTPF